MKPVLRGIAVAIAAVGIAACVKQAWQVTYPGPENYSLGSAVLVEKNGTAYMAGYLNETSAFVAAYNASGKKLWERVLEGDGFVRSNFGRTLEQDNEGNLYLLQSVMLGQPVLFKLSKSGELLESKALEKGFMATHFRMIDDVLYAGFLNTPMVNAYGLDGAFLWSYSFVSGDVSSPESGQPLAKAAVSKTASSNGYAALWGSKSILEREGRLYLPTLLGVVELDHSGNTVLFRSTAELGLDSIYQVVEIENGLMVLGEYDQSTYAVTLDLDLSELSRVPVATSLANGALASSGDGVVCVSVQEPDGSAIRLLQVSSSGHPNWSQIVPWGGNAWEFADVLASGTSCYLTVEVQNEDDTLLARTQRYDNAGALTDTFSLPDFGILGMTVQGKSVYHVGITGEYDNSVTIATLDKQSRK